MADQDDEIGSDEGFSTAENAESAEKGRESKPNKAKKRAKPQANAEPTSGAPETQPDAAPEDAALVERSVKAPDSKRAIELQKRARESVGAIKRRIGQTIKCPGCEEIAYAAEWIYDKPESDPSRVKIARRIRCDNTECQYLKNTGRKWSRKVAPGKEIRNGEEDTGVMSARQMDHLTRERE